MKFEMGIEVRDRVTGFKGVITGYAHYMFGCDQFLVMPNVRDDGTAQDGKWFDDGRISIVPEGRVVPIEAVQGTSKGGPCSDSPTGRS